MGGRIAEDVKLGDITSGASGDIKMATKLARAMVCIRMSDLGPIAYGDNQDHVFQVKKSPEIRITAKNCSSYRLGNTFYC